MIDELCVIGHPSTLGGADTELDHQIRCWHEMGIEVHLCHTMPYDGNALAMQMEERGCIYHEPRDWESIQGMHCISFCNSQFLKGLKEIKRYARSTSFVNCMTWNFDDEVRGQKEGLIDFHLYQTKHAYDRVSLKLKDEGKYRPLFFTPFFYAEEFPYVSDRPQDKFRFGRISRDDPGKFSSQQLWIYETMTAPVDKQGLILGWSDNVESKFGRRPEPFIQVLPACSLSQRAFYAQCEAIIMSTDTFENLPRVGFEAMASGSILVVDDKGGWRSQVNDGITGWLCRDNREFIYKASRCAYEEQERNEMRHAARENLENQWGMQAAMDSWAQVFEAWERVDSRSATTPEINTSPVMVN
ncbi:Glycosyl transferases group 1 [Thalassoglobus neptunius]|uniref:Glycosyl transferases group 1 n=1 Tax=Thalassoglobus neptunius TaxID=1938619 RepID=A0A5C5VP57_9PLAN|nr:glycosyltransferase [Thalassoglobus neptunius]TWT39907.1 Glycosyl transferases group 1 [Thalassoglobus neptunius]